MMMLFDSIWSKMIDFGPLCFWCHYVGMGGIRLYISARRLRACAHFCARAHARLKVQSKNCLCPSMLKKGCIRAEIFSFLLLNNCWEKAQKINFSSFEGQGNLCLLFHSRKTKLWKNYEWMCDENDVILLQTTYSSVPNKRPVWNKRPLSKIIENLISVLVLYWISVFCGHFLVYKI